MSRKKQAAAARKQQGRMGKSLLPKGTGGGSNKDAGLPSFFKHRKEAFARAAAEAQHDSQEGDLGDAISSRSREKGKTKADENEMMDEETPAAGSSSKTLSETILQQAQNTANSSFTFTSSTNTNPFDSASIDPALTGHRDSSLRAYMSQLRKLISSSDILLQVLDARDPLSCRSHATETLALSQGKRIILVLNKIDLVPRENVEKWLKYLRHDFPTLAFKSSTQSQRKNLAQGAGSIPTSGPDSNVEGTGALGSGSEALGAQALLQLLKNYSRNQNLKTSLTVGVFGAPNVGKSSLINSLKRARVCAVASTPGHTKVLQSVMLDKKIRLIDCPGIVFNEKAKGSSGDSGQKPADTDARAAALRNTIKVELLQDPISPIAVVLSRVPLAQLEKLYNLPLSEPSSDNDPTKLMTQPTPEDVQAFLLRLALRKGRLLSKGGAPDLEGTARSVLQDWNNGRIKYATQPPAVHPSAVLSSSATTVQPAAGEMSKEEQEKAQAAEAIAATTSLKTSFDAEFDLAGLLGESDAEALLGAGTNTQPEEGIMDTSEAPQTSDNTGRGSLAADKSGKLLLRARERRYATEADLEPSVPEGAAQIEVDDDEPIDKAANQTISSLGKRTRGFDDSSDEDDDEDDSIRVPGLTDDDDDGSDEEARENIPPRKQARPTLSENHYDSADLPSWLERQRNKATTVRQSKKAQERGRAAQGGKMALLSTIFSPHELEGLAPSRKAARKKASKEKRRAEKSSAGGLTDILAATMDFSDEDGEDFEEDQDLNPSVTIAGTDKDEDMGGDNAKRNEQGADFSLLAVQGDEDAEEEL